MLDFPETRYVERGAVHLAYQTLDDGEGDVFYLSYPTAPVDLMWDDSLLARGLRRLATVGHLITCDGCGAVARIQLTSRMFPPCSRGWTTLQPCSAR